MDTIISEIKAFNFNSGDIEKDQEDFFTKCKEIVIKLCTSPSYGPFEKLEYEEIMSMLVMDITFYNKFSDVKHNDVKLLNIIEDTFEDRYIQATYRDKLHLMNILRSNNFDLAYELLYNTTITYLKKWNMYDDMIKRSQEDKKESDYKTEKELLVTYIENNTKLYDSICEETDKYEKTQNLILELENSRNTTGADIINNSNNHTLDQRVEMLQKLIKEEEVISKAKKELDDLKEYIQLKTQQRTTIFDSIQLGKKNFLIFDKKEEIKNIRDQQLKLEEEYETNRITLQKKRQQLCEELDALKN